MITWFNADCLFESLFFKLLSNGYRVEIKCVTWEKDSHGLFDYESKSVSREVYRIDNPCQIVR